MLNIAAGCEELSALLVRMGEAQAPHILAQLIHETSISESSLQCQCLHILAYTSTCMTDKDPNQATVMPNYLQNQPMAIW